MGLLLHVLREGRWIESAPLSDLPFSIGSRGGSDLVLPELEGRQGRVVLGPDGIPEYRGVADSRRVALQPGTHLELGPYTLAVAPAPEARSGGPEAVLERILELLPDLWDETAGRPDLHALLASLVELFGASWGALVRLPEDGGEPELVHQAGDRAARGARLSRTVLRRVMEAEGPVLVDPGLEAGGGTPVASIPLEVRSVLAAPLPGEGEPLGLVYLESPRSRKTFSPAERATLRTLCRFAAAHLESRREASLSRTRGAALAHLYREEVAGHHDLEGIVGRSPAMQAVLAAVRQAGPTDVTTLVLGESGTGKELVAGALHRAGRRARGPLVAVNCSALPADLVESELFGHRRGAFTGASEDRPGRFQMADGGTLFLDELGELPLPAQAKLLRALETRRVVRVGDSREEAVDVRVVAATKVDLAEAVRAGRFREDLYFRLEVFTIRLPPLRERPEDLPDLVESLVGLLGRLHGRRISGVTAQAMELLRAHAWPGNVRELRNVLEQALVRSDGDWIQAGALGLPGSQENAPARSEDRYPDDLEGARALFERQHIARCLEAERGDVDRTAARLGIARSNLYKRMKEYGLDPARFRDRG